jgi:hypothetical protein
MIIIKRFIDKVSSIKGNNLVLPIEEAKMLRDEISKLLADNYELHNKPSSEDDTVIQLEINGGKW